MAKRRANGEGNIRKRKDGRWEGRYTAGHDPETGRAIYRNVLGRTQAEVREKLKAAIGEAQGLDAAKTGKYTVGQWMDVWYENYAKIKVRPSSHQTYRGYIENHIKPNIGSMPLNKLSSLELQKLYKKLLSRGRVTRLEAKNQPKGLSPKTVRNIHQILESAMRLATRYTDFVCVDAMGTLLQPDYITQKFQQILGKYGLRKIRFHDLRHSCATIILYLGYTLKDIQTWLGHSNYNFTADTYIHSGNGVHEQMAARLSEELNIALPLNPILTDDSSMC